MHEPPNTSPVWLITGCSSGLGLALATAALVRGHRVMATARQASALSHLTANFPETCRALSLDVIAEGVENEPQMLELSRLDCDYAQGHLFSRALPAEKISALLSEGVPLYSGIAPGR